MDEYNELENIYFGKIKLDNETKTIRTKGLYEYVNLLDTPKNPSPYVNYRLLVQLCTIFRENRSQHVIKKLIEYGTIKESSSEMDRLISLAGNYADDFDKPSKVEIQLDEKTKKAIKNLVDALTADDEPPDLQNSIYQIAKNVGLQPKDFFKTLYQIILASDRGPKIGPFIIDIGRKKIAHTLTEHL
jgi:lysyl-tRNA synthetase class 1